MKLDESPINIYGSYTVPAKKQKKSHISIKEQSISEQEQTSIGGYFSAINLKLGLIESRIDGVFINFNMIEAYEEADRAKVLADFFQPIKDAIKEKKWKSDPSLLNRFICLTYADLKKYTFQYKYFILLIVYFIKLLCSNI